MVHTYDGVHNSKTEKESSLYNDIEQSPKDIKLKAKYETMYSI